MIQLLVLDLDNTLLTKDKRLPQETILAVKAIQEKGVLVTLATGRAYELTKPYADLLNINLPLILNNGALIKHHEPETIVSRRHMQASAIRDFYRFATKNNYGYAIYSEAGIYTSDPERIAFYQAWNKTYPSSTIHVIKHPSLDTLLEKPLYKMLIVIKDYQQFKAAIDHNHARQDATIVQSMQTFFDVLPPDTSKGKALKQLMENYHLKPDQVMAFGDNDNDAPMFELVGHAIAMPDGSEKARNASTQIACDISDNNGVAKTLQSFDKAGYFQS